MRPPSYDRAATDFGESARTSHISKMVLSIVKFGGPDLQKGKPLLHQRELFLLNLPMGLGEWPITPLG